MSSAYPLQWPEGWKRNDSYTWPRFSKISIPHAFGEIEDELNHLNATDVVITSNSKTGRFGNVLDNQTNVKDVGVAVYFTWNGTEHCIPSDKFNSVWANARAITLTVEALRGLERWGTGQIMEAAFRGFAALPEAIVTPHRRPWHEVLEVLPNASPEVIRAAYKQRLHKSHPDHGGSDSDFQEVQEAFKQAQEVR